MKVLFLTPELAGYVKAGGLADVSAALPKALRARGLDVRILMPFYGPGPEWRPSLEVVARLDGIAGIPPCMLATGVTRDGDPAWFIIAPQLFEREGSPYADNSRHDWPDNDIRFARLAFAAVQLIGGEANTEWRPDIVHANDWPSALVAGYLAWRGQHVPTLYTIHNLAYQGLFDPARLSALAIPFAAYSINGVEFYGRLSFMKAGLFYSSHVTTVSPGYAREIATEQFGAGLHGLLGGLAANGRLTGILNGIGDDWAPERDASLVRQFPPHVAEGKRANAAWLRQTVGLDAADRPLFIMVSRLVHQKGVDLTLQAAGTIVAGGGQLFVLGQGEPELERMAQETATRFSGAVAVNIAFNEPLARRAIAASDFTLMPSRFEPSGLNQMYAEKYGSLPIAHATGGLADSIRDGETGFLFGAAAADELESGIIRALNAYVHPAQLAGMRRTAMAQDFSWGSAAAKYEELYRGLLAR